MDGNEFGNANRYVPSEIQASLSHVSYHLNYDVYFLVRDPVRAAVAGLKESI